MKREILFRGKLSHNNKWLIGNLVFSQEGTPYIIPSGIIEQDGHHLKIFDDNAYWVNNNTIWQYIGLKDRNRVRIFKDDIVKIYRKNTETGEIDVYIGSVVFIEKALLFAVNTNSETISFDIMFNNAGFYSYIIEVIGNIYDNKDLLK